MARASRLTVVAFALAISGASAGATAEGPLVVRADVQVAGFRTHQQLGDAIRILGRPASLRPLPGFQHACDASWPQIGLVMRFFAAGCTAKSAFARALATSTRWRTIRKLRVGDPVNRLRALYPGVRPSPATDGSERWPLFRRGRANAGLTAITSNGHVTELIVSAFGVRVGG